MSFPVLNVVLPLSPETTFRLEIYGKFPTDADVQRIKDALDASVLLASGKVDQRPAPRTPDISKPPDTREWDKPPIPPGVQAKREHGKIRHMKDLGPCPIHGHLPDYKGRHPKTNRCIQCATDHINNVRQGRLANLPPKPAKPADRKIKPPKDPRLAVVWSEVQGSCLKCGDRAVRLHRSALADLSKDYWVHDRPSGLIPCLIKIVSNDHIRTDTQYDPEEETVAHG